MNTDRHVPAAVLFDMDGTLTEPMLDFARIKRDMGIGDDAILEALATMNAADRARAEAVLHRHEDDAAKRSRLNPGCREVLSLLNDRGVGVALITRNSRQSVQTVLATHGLAIDVLISREDAPPKPDPEPLYLACRKLDVAPADAWMVGDGEFDVRAGLNAGARTIWLSHGRARHFPESPWREIADLWALATLLSD